MLSPILEKIAREYENKFILAKVNVDESKEKATQFGVMGIPSVKLFKNGDIVDEFTGVMPEESVKGWLDKNL
jgi:putative thioredoxin